MKLEVMQGRDNMKTRKSRPTETGVLIGVRLQVADLARVDDWRKGQPDLPTRPEAIRRLIEAHYNRSGDQRGVIPALRDYIAAASDKVPAEERDRFIEGVQRALSLSDDELDQHLSAFIERLIQTMAQPKRS
jgi:hypothetical protein